MSAKHMALAAAVFVMVLPTIARGQRSDPTCTTLRMPTVGALDTVITLDIRDRTWQRDSVTTGVAFGASGSTDSQRAPWRACVGVSALLGHITANLHNVRGRIHLRVDPSALDSIGHSSPSPAVPPRR